MSQTVYIKLVISFTLTQSVYSVVCVVLFHTYIGKMVTIDRCISGDRENCSIVVDMDGALLINPNPFPYFALIAFDVGGIFRLGILLLLTPVFLLFYNFKSKYAGVRVLVFATFVGVKVSDIESAAKAVLPKHYSEDLHPETWRVFSSCGKKCVVTMNPRIMVEPFLKNYLDVEFVSGAEISSFMGIATGFVATSAVVNGQEFTIALKNAFGSSSVPDIGIGHCESHFSLSSCKELYTVSSSEQGTCPVSPDKLPKPVIFHDGRLVQKPTPLIALLILVWFPVGILLSLLRIILGLCFPFSYARYVMPFLGCKINVKGTPPRKPSNSNNIGALVVASHRCVLDPIFISIFLGRRTAGLTYSVSRLTEFLSPIRTCRLTRDRAKDMAIMKQMLDEGWNLIICPEGTTCREPYLLRFSALFAEITDEIFPVAVSLNVGMFHGSTARGYKFLDAIFFFMNPLPVYDITFLNKLSVDRTCSATRCSHETANKVQEMIGEALKYKCTKLTRKDKYQMLVGTDGLVGRN